MHQIVDRAAFAQKLRVAHDVENRTGTPVSFDRLADLVPRLDGHGALVDDYTIRIRLEHGCDFPRHALDVAQVDAAIRLRRGRHRDEHDLGVIDAVLYAMGKTQAAGSHIAQHEFLEARLVYGNAPRLQGLDLARIVIHTDDVVAYFRETGSADEPDITAADNRKIHSKIRCFPGGRMDLAELVLANSGNWDNAQIEARRKRHAF